MDISLFSYKGAKQVFFSLAILTIFHGLSIIIQAFFLAQAISSLFRGDLFHDLIEDIVMFLLALFVRQIIVVLKKNLAYHFATRTSKELRKTFIQTLFELGPRFVKEEGSGQTVTLVMEGTMKFRRYLELFVQKIINIIIIPASICFYLYFVDRRSALILIIVLPILIGFMILLGKAAKNKSKSQFESFNLLSNHFVDSLRGLETLKYLGLSKKHIEQIGYVSERYRKATMGTLRVAFLSSFALDFFTMLSIATVAVFLGLGLINGVIELQTALTILILAPEYFLPVRELGSDFHATLDGKNAGQKIHKILSEKNLHQGHEDIEKWKPTSTLSVERLGIKFKDREIHSLQDISFTISGPLKIGIIGASGSGKSTLIDLLSGFSTPSEGEFFINGHKVSGLNHKSWQHQITYIPQHPYIFHDSIINNIRFYDREATLKEVEEAVKKAGLMEMIEELPQGLETVIGEGGKIVSGGQEQRIALARSYLGNRPVLMLDEPTAHLDIETEAELKETMVQIFNQKLVFLATHRLHWMLEMDQILVLDQGNLVETGTHEQLMENRGTYYQLVCKQMGGI